MKEFLTEWLIRFGTGTTTWDQIGHWEVERRMRAHAQGYLAAGIGAGSAYFIATKGLKFLKEGE